MTRQQRLRDLPIDYLGFHDHPGFALGLDRSSAGRQYVLEPVHALPIGQINDETIGGGHRHHRSNVLPSRAASRMPDNGDEEVAPPSQLQHTWIGYVLVKGTHRVGYRPYFQTEDRYGEHQQQCYVRKDDPHGKTPQRAPSSGFALVSCCHEMPPSHFSHLTPARFNCRAVATASKGEYPCAFSLFLFTKVPRRRRGLRNSLP